MRLLFTGNETRQEKTFNLQFNSGSMFKGNYAIIDVHLNVLCKRGHSVFNVFAGKMDCLLFSFLFLPYFA